MMTICTLKLKWLGFCLSCSVNILDEHKQFKFSAATIGIPLYTVLLLWIIFWIEIKYDLYFSKYGLYPRTFTGLRGIVLSPFIHGSTQHLFNNSIPLLVLFTTLLYFYREIVWKVLLYGMLLSGFITWLIARPSYHIGASGVIYLLFSFILFSGIIRKYYRLVAVSLIVIFLYGSIIWYIFPISEEISWEGHLSGFIIGLLLAIIYKNYGPQRAKYEWEDEDYIDEYLEDNQ